MCNRFDKSCCELDPGPEIPVRLPKLGRVDTCAISNPLPIFCSSTLAGGPNEPKAWILKA